MDFIFIYLIEKKNVMIKYYLDVLYFLYKLILNLYFNPTL